MPNEYDVGLIYLKPDGETDALVYRLKSPDKAAALKAARERFHRTYPSTYQILLHEITQIVYHSYNIWIWFEYKGKKGDVWYHFLPQAGSALEAFKVANRLFLILHDSDKVTILRQEISLFIN